MKVKERFLKAFAREKTDRLPVTTHHVMPYYTKKHLNGMNGREFFKHFGIDPIEWVMAYSFDPSKGDFPHASDSWVIFLAMLLPYAIAQALCPVNSSS